MIFLTNVMLKMRHPVNINMVFYILVNKRIHLVTKSKIWAILPFNTLLMGVKSKNLLIMWLSSRPRSIQKRIFQLSRCPRRTSLRLSPVILTKLTLANTIQFYSWFYWQVLILLQSQSFILLDQCQDEKVKNNIKGRSTMLLWRKK